MNILSRISPVFALAAVLALSPPPAGAETLSQDKVLKARILPGWRTDRGTQMAGLRLELAPGWKTYWRSPGEAGIPPQFDWSGSENVKSLRLLWPSPQVFDTNGMQTIGYHDLLVLPVEIVPKDPAKPVRLAATVELGICRDICLPATVSIRDSGGAASGKSSDPEITAALSRQPSSAREAGLARIRCEVEPIRDGLRLTARMQIPAGGGRETVAFETADPGIWIAEASSKRQGAELISSTELVPPSGQPFALNRSEVTVTVISGKGSVEIFGCPGG